MNAERGSSGARVSARAVVLLMTLIVITIGALVGSTVLYYAGSTSHSAQIGLRAAPSRAMAWSGVQAVMSELAAQREEILQGKKPSITEYWAASGPGADSPGTPRWGFRVLEMQTATGDAGEGWVACEPEMGKL
ncbi:MAG: hypothetical protein AB7G11_12805, partial [Phycisphaerales bacterium]